MASAGRTERGYVRSVPCTDGASVGLIALGTLRGTFCLGGRHRTLRASGCFFRYTGRRSRRGIVRFAPASDDVT